MFVHLDLLHPDLWKKVCKTSKLQPTAPKKQLSVEDPVLVQDYRKSQDPWIKGVVVAKLGHVTYCVQVKELFWKQHIDQLKDLSGMQIQPHGQEQLEDCEVNVLQLFFAAYSTTKMPVTTVGHFSSHSEPAPNQSKPMCHRGETRGRTTKGSCKSRLMQEVWLPLPDCLSRETLPVNWQKTA